MTIISLTVLDEDADRLARELRTEVLGLDVDRVDLVPDGEVPPGTNADAATVTTIVVALSGSPVLVQLVGLLRDWVNRAASRKVILREGDRSLELTAGSASDNREVIEAFFRE